MSAMDGGLGTRLVEEFEACDQDGKRYAIACYQDKYDRPTTSGRERVAGIKRYQLTAGQQLERVDDRTFLTAQGVVLRRCRKNCPPGAKDCVEF